jgi:hypothetical protein
MSQCQPVTEGQGWPILCSSAQLAPGRPIAFSVIWIVKGQGSIIVPLLDSKQPCLHTWKRCGRGPGGWCKWLHSFWREFLSTPRVWAPFWHSHCISEPSKDPDRPVEEQIVSIKTEAKHPVYAR